MSSARDEEALLLAREASDYEDAGYMQADDARALIRRRLRRDVRTPLINALCITLYNEDEIAFGDTLCSTLRAVRRYGSQRQVYAPECMICIVADGRSSLSPGVARLLQRCHLVSKRDGTQAGNLQVHSGVHCAGVLLELLEAERTADALAIDSLVHILVCLKDQNAGKLDSHNVFFDLLCRELDPVYCYQIDTGTCLHPDALIRFTEYLESNPGIGAIAPRVLPSVPRRTDSFFTTWQFTDLAFRNGITWPAEVMSGFLSVIPGQTGALRWAAMKTPSGDCDVTTAYLRGVLEGGALTKTMYLAEDRVIGILLCLTHERWQLGFVPPAAVTTDSCDTLRELLQQRRRWINSALACRFWLLRYWTRDVCRRRETKGRWGFSFALLFQILIGLRDFFAPAQLVALIATMMAGVSALFGSRAGVAQFVISLMIVLEAGFLAFDARRLRQGLAPAFAIARQCWGWCTAAALLALILSLREPLFALVMLAPCAVLVPLFVLAPRKSFALLVRTQFCPLPNLMVVLFTQSYAYWRLHDISWGTKGLRKAWNDGDTARGLRILRRTVISLWVSSNGLLIVCALTAEGIFHRALNPVIEMACIVDFIFALMATAFLVLRRYAGQAGGRVRGAFADSANCGWHAE